MQIGVLIKLNENNSKEKGTCEWLPWISEKYEKDILLVFLVMHPEKNLNFYLLQGKSIIV